MAVPLDDNFVLCVAVANVIPFFVAIVDDAVNHASRVDSACRPFVFVSTEHSQTNKS